MPKNILEIENQNLFTDLDENSAELVSGGAVTITNTLDRQVNYRYAVSSYEWQYGSLKPGEQFQSHNPTTLYFDHQIGYGESYTLKPLNHGSYAFESKDYKTLELNNKNSGGININGNGNLNFF